MNENQKGNPPSATHTPPATQMAPNDSSRLEDVIPAPSDTQPASSNDQKMARVASSKKPAFPEIFKMEGRKELERLE